MYESNFAKYIHAYSGASDARGLPCTSQAWSDASNTLFEQKKSQASKVKVWSNRYIAGFCSAYGVLFCFSVALATISPSKENASKQFWERHTYLSLAACGLLLIVSACCIIIALVYLAPLEESPSSVYLICAVGVISFSWSVDRFFVSFRFRDSMKRPISSEKEQGYFGRIATKVSHYRSLYKANLAVGGKYFLCVSIVRKSWRLHFKVVPS